MVVIVYWIKRVKGSRKKSPLIKRGLSVYLINFIAVDRTLHPIIVLNMKLIIYL